MENLPSEILAAVSASFINSSLYSDESLRPKLLYNDTHIGCTVLANLVKELQSCKSFWFSVAFITKSGLIALKETLKDLEIKGVKGQILTTDYLSFSEPDALKDLLKFPNLEVRIFTKNQFHTKGYMFKHEDNRVFIIGSSNLTQTALKSNKEWNLKITALAQGDLITQIESEFKRMWEDADILTHYWIDNVYSPIYFEKKNIKHINVFNTDYPKLYISPNSMQREALKSLFALRNNNQNKALLISATGTGKTYLAAFDVYNFKPKRLLFLVHREQILRQAIESFKVIFGKDFDAGLLTGNSKNCSAKFLFSTVQTMSKENIYTKFSPDDFDYIIIDEAHRAGANGYLKFLQYFSPKFLLGLTATPERMDNFDVYKLFDYNIAYEIRLDKAMEEDLLCPFHYFGISEIAIDGNVIDDADFSKIFPYLTCDVRVQNIIDKLNFYGYSGNRAKGLIFCRKIEEADILSEKFNKKGYRTVSINSKSNTNIEQAIERLEQDEWTGGLDYIFTVDMFNEGVDIPAVNQIIMLRPTKSSIVFVQQLGRGLRKYSDKEFTVVIDFIGNYSNNFMIPIALSGDKSYDKDLIRKYVAEGNRTIPGCSTINFDKIAQKRIYESIDRAKFDDYSLLKETYFSLKNKLGRIPKMKDYCEYGTIDVMKIIEKCGSYYHFLKKVEKDYQRYLSPIEENVVRFLSRQLATGKRIYELEFLKIIVNYTSTGRHFIDVYKNVISDEYNIKIDTITQLSIEQVLSNRFKDWGEGCVLIERHNDDYVMTDSFKTYLSNPDFRDIFDEIIDFGIDRYNQKYKNHYKNTDFVLYEKYTYEDVCRILKWKKNINAQAIGGYFYDESTATVPIFINYVKPSNLAERIDYDHGFLSPQLIKSMSKPKRSFSSREMTYIVNAPANHIRTFLFVRKNKKDGNKASEFFFLGEMFSTGEAELVERKNVGDTVIKFLFKLDTPVRDDIYEYFTTNINN